MNSGIYDGAYPNAMKNADRDSIMNGVGHWLGVTPGERKNVLDMGQISKNDGQSNTMLLTENVDAVSWAYVAPNLNGGEESLNCVYWTPNDKWLDPTTSGNSSQQQYGINKFRNNLPDDQLLQKAATNDPELIAYARPSSNHTQGVNVLYCDGHVDSMADDISYARYVQALSVSNTKSRHPKINNGTTPVPVQLLQPTN